MNNSTERGGGRPSVVFTIDGVEYTSEDRRYTASELLLLAGLNPDDHDLARVLGQGQVERILADESEVQITPGDKFVSIFTGSTPVV